MHVSIEDEKEVTFEGQRMSWDDFLDRVDEIVTAWNEGTGPKPWIVILATQSTPPGSVQRLMNLVHRAGVDSIQLGH